MTETILRLIWLFPIVFILHDFEELILFEPWLKKNAPELKVLIKQRFPAFLEKQIAPVLDKTSPQFALPISLIFLLTLIATVLFADFGLAAPFLYASSLYFLHGFMHIGQALLLRKYIPALMTSLLVVLPYGFVLFWNLLTSQMINLPTLLIYFVLTILTAIPFILIMHLLGERLYQTLIRFIIK